MLTLYVFGPKLCGIGPLSSESHKSSDKLYVSSKQVLIMNKDCPIEKTTRPADIGQTSTRRVKLLDESPSADMSGASPNSSSAGHKRPTKSSSMKVKIKKVDSSQRTIRGFMIAKIGSKDLKKGFSRDNTSDSINRRPYEPESIQLTDESKSAISGQFKRSETSSSPSDKAESDSTHL